MFYIILFSIVISILGLYCLFRFVIFKNNQKFQNVVNTILKVLVVVYVCIMLLSVLLPDAFKLSYSEEDLASMECNVGYTLIRWFSMTSFVTLPIAVFYKNRTIRNIAIYFGLAITISQICYLNEYLQDFTSTSGRGLNSISVISSSFKDFLLNESFRKITFGIVMGMQLIIPIILSVNDKHLFNFKKQKEYLHFLLTLPCVIISAVPIYVCQHLFGYTNIIFEPYSLIHFGWFALLICEVVVLYYIFRKKDNETKMVVLYVLALSLIMQYLQMFSAISINAARFPFQLCNLGAFFILLSLITNNKKLFNFTVIINVIGVIFALASPDLDGKGLFYLYNMHFVLEHSNVLIIPILALMFGIFPRLNRASLKDCLLGFVIYFVCVWVIGTMFNAIEAQFGGSGFWSANYLFMFDATKATKLLGDWIGKLFVSFEVTLYPIIQLVVLSVFLIVCLLLWLLIQVIYKVKDVKKNNLSQEKKVDNKVNENNQLETAEIEESGIKK